MKKLFTLLLALSVLMISLMAGCDSNKEKENAKETQATTEASKKLTEDEAIQIAMEHAKLSKDAVTRLHAEYEIDDGVPTWEINFDHERMEYDYEINAETGDIISYDVDDD